MFGACLTWVLAEESGTHGFQFKLEPLLDDAGLPLALVGMFMVFLALGIVVMFISCLPRLIEQVEKWLPTGGHGSKPSAPPSKKKEEDADQLLQVVLAAAVAAAISEPHRIVFARDTSDSMAWAREGRRQIQTSHRVN